MTAPAPQLEMQNTNDCRSKSANILKFNKYTVILNIGMKIGKTPHGSKKTSY